MSTTRHINLRGWFDYEETKPMQFIIVEVCDADSRGYADYNFYGYRNGKEFRTIPGDRILEGHTYWRPASAKEVDRYLKRLKEVERGIMKAG